MPSIQADEVDQVVSYEGKDEKVWCYYTCIVELNNYINGWQMVRAGLSLLEWVFIDEQGRLQWSMW